MRVLIVADDLTGANEIAALFVSAGLFARVYLRVPPAPKDDRTLEGRDLDVVVLDTESRNLDPEAARERVRRFVEQVAFQRPPLVYKKVDSTLRGPIGAEVDALMDRLGLKRAVVVPAFPAQGRTTVAGYQLVYGVPVQFTPAGEDLVAPARQAHLPTLLREATGRRVGVVPIEVVQEGHRPLMDALEKAFQDATICVVDAATEDHLDGVARALLELDGPVLGVGTAGLARYLARRLASGGSQSIRQTNVGPGASGDGEAAATGRAPGTRPRLVEGRSAHVLVVVGSRHPVSQTQLERLQAERPSAAFTLGEMPEEALGGQAGEALRQGSVVLRAPREPWGQGRNPAQEVAGALGRVVRAAVAATKPGALVLTGGETAYHVLTALGAETLHMVDEVEQGVPSGWVEGGLAAGLPVVTKAGGFGEPDALVNAIAYLHQRAFLPAGNLPSEEAAP